MRTAAALALLLAITVGLYWKLTLSNGYTWLENPDQALQVRPWLDLQSRELHAGRLPFWDPYQYGGQSLIGQVQPGVVNPLNWPLFAMPLREGHIPLETLHWYWVLIRWVAAAFCFWLCRDLGASWLASVFGASAFALTGFIGHSGTPQFLMSAVWAPLVLLFFTRVWRGERPLANAALCGAALGLQFLSGHHNVPIYTAILLGALWLWRLRSRRMIVAAALFVGACGLVAAVQVLPAVEYGREAVRWSGAPEPQRWKDRIPYSVHAEYSLQWRSVPGIVLPGRTVHANPFVGVVVLGFALSGGLLAGRKPEARLLLAFALGGLVLALGRDTPVHRALYEVVPMVEKARYPAMCIVLFQAGIAGLAALGLDRFRRFRGGTFLAVAALALFLAETVRNPPPIIRPRNLPDSYAKMIASQADIADFLRRQPGWFRVEMDDEAVPYNFGDWHGIEHFGGYTASLPVRVHAVIGHPETTRLFGVRYRVAKQAKHPGQVEVFQSVSGLRVYREPAVADPLWVIRDAPCNKPDRLRTVSRTSGSAVFETELGCPGTVVAGDPWFTGWRAWVDGSRVRVQQVESLLRGVSVEAGSHRIEFRYRPGSVYWGAGLTLLGFVLVFATTRYGETHSPKP